MSEVEIVDVPTLKVVGIRQQGSYFKIGEMIPMVFSYVSSQVTAKIAGPPIFVCHETNEADAVKADEEGCADIEICVPISGELKGEGEYTVYELPGGKMAKILHKGAYEDCGPIYQKLFGWILEKGYTLIGPTREVYLNDPRDVPKEEILTEIYAPIQ